MFSYSFFAIIRLVRTQLATAHEAHNSAGRRGCFAQ
nr:MAG TPA: hypothetical protein [Caudoviricetes sp.]